MRHYNMITSALAALSVLAAASCAKTDDGYKFANSVYLDVSATTQEHLTTFSNKTASLTRPLVVTLAYPSNKDVTATVRIDKSLVAEYNSLHGTSYEMVPDGYVDFAGAVVRIPAGHAISETLSLNLVNLTGSEDGSVAAMQMDNTYLLPVRISSDDIKVMDGADKAYYFVRRSSQITTAAFLGLGNWINFPLMDSPGTIADAYNGLSAVTYEALIYIDDFITGIDGHSGAVSISSVMGVEQYLLMRIGDTSFEREQIQFDGSGSGPGFGKFPKRDATKKLETGRWYHVACTYDQSTRICRVYVDGKIQSEQSDMGTATSPINLAMRALGTADAYQFFIGKSYNDYRPLNGKIAEARVWSVARTPQQIWDNMYRITDPEEHPELIGYWKFDEGSGNTVKDYSLYHNDGVAQADLVWPSGIEIPEINKSE